MQKGGEHFKLSPKLRTLLDTMYEESKCYNLSKISGTSTVGIETEQVGDKRQISESHVPCGKRKCVDSTNHHPLFYVVTANRKIGNRPLPKLVETKREICYNICVGN